MAVPKYDDLFTPLLLALFALGGSASVEEIDDEVAKSLKLSEEDINQIHKGKGYSTQLSYNLAWTRYYLKIYGLIENSKRGVWRLTQEGRHLRADIDKKDIKKFVRLHSSKGLNQGDAPNDNTSDSIEPTWEEDLISEVYKLSPKAFEQLVQRILREAGFIQVEVTGRSGDGGIDGKGILRLNGFLSFRVLFQCKRYSHSIPSKEIRDFRGAMEGRADKGLFITTSTFTRDAKQEAVRDGATAIDLIDAHLLAAKMKELGLGVTTEHEELVRVNTEFFEEYKTSVSDD